MIAGIYCKVCLNFKLKFLNFCFDECDEKCGRSQEREQLLEHTRGDYHSCVSFLQSSGHLAEILVSTVNT